MADGRRPGGLTALAVLNFVFAGLGLLGLLAVLALLTAADVSSGGELTGGGGISKGMIYVALLLGIVRMGVLLTAGIGYIKQKRFLGRTLGNVYAILAIADTIIGIALLKQGLGIGGIIGLVYPVLTLVLINTTFKDDLVN